MDAKQILAPVMTGSLLAVIAGSIYIADCRASGGEVDKCWLTGLPIAGLGGAAGGGFRMGYETLNPALRSRDASALERPIVDDPDA
jgi:hypothetical protein